MQLGNGGHGILGYLRGVSPFESKISVHFLSGPNSNMTTKGIVGWLNIVHNDIVCSLYHGPDIPINKTML